ncbi:MAG: hypothetical protein IPJ83_14560 [Saprospiraceae bacterium]|nr:hypothetical protein [Candidatus Vicinibacter proximus]
MKPNSTELIQILKHEYINSIKEIKTSAPFYHRKENAIKLNAENVIAYHDFLMFILAHPNHLKTSTWASGELKKISQWCKRFGNKHQDILDNSGLPYSKIYSYFSYALICWLKENKIDVDLDNYPEDAYTLNEALWLCLPAYERDIVQQELNNTQLLSALKIKPDQYLNFLLGQFSKLDQQAAIRDYLFERQKLVIRLTLDLKVSRSYNKIKFEKTYLQKDWIKKIQTEEWVKIPVILDRKLSQKDKQAIITSSRIKLALLQRETDPVSYMDPRSIRYFALERGTSIALFTMQTEKQLYPESYVGYTLYKNGYPAAYGGAWIFGKHALIGVNIFEWFRGGESTFFFNQLLRVYHQVFGVLHFEVEPYQYGKDNPEGIESGAFWFYYRMGFRPVKRSLYLLAAREWEKIKQDKAYRTKPPTLKKFTECNVRLSLIKEKIFSGNLLKKQITKMIVHKFGGDRRKAELVCLEWLKLNMNENISTEKKNSIPMTELALMCHAMNFPVKHHKDLIQKMIVNKSKDLFAYQENILEWLELVRF